MIEYEELYKQVKNKLSDKRFKHSEGVVKRAIEYAKIYNVDINTVKLAAISHDIAKELDPDEIKYYIEKYNINPDYLESHKTYLLHSQIGACICKDIYGFSEDMFNSIKYHTTGRANMSLLEKIIFLADATEENRKHCSSEEYVNMIKTDINKGMVEICKWFLNYLLTNNKEIHQNSIDCYNYYLRRIDENEK